MKNKGLYTVLLITILFLAACGPQAYEPVSAVSSSSDDNNSGSGSIITDTSSGKLLTQCSRDVGNSSMIRARVMSVISNNGSVNPDYVRVKITLAPELSSNSNAAIEMYKGFVTSTGLVQFASNPNSSSSAKQDLPMLFERKVNGSFSQLTGSSFTDLTWSNLLNFVLKPNSYDDDITTSASFFGNISMLVNLGPNGSIYKFIQLATYNGSTKTGDTAILLPPFDSNYDNYAAANPSVLSDLHPMKSFSSLGYSDAQYGAQASTICF